MLTLKDKFIETYESCWIFFEVASLNAKSKPSPSTAVAHHYKNKNKNLAIVVKETKHMSVNVFEARSEIL